MSVSAVPTRDEKLFEEQRPVLRADDGDPDQIEVALTGTIQLDRTNAEHVKLFNGLRLGRHLDVVVAAVVVAQPRRVKFDSDANVSDRILRATLRAEDLTLAEDDTA